MDPAVLGIALFVMAFAATVTMPLAGIALGSFGSRPTTAVLMLAFTAFLPLPLLAGSIPVFFVSVLVFGSTIGSLDVSMNLQATEIEAARQKPTMSSFHGFFSVGGLVGRLGAAIIAAGWGDGSGATLLAAVLFALAILAGFNLSQARPPPTPDRILPCPTAPRSRLARSPCCALASRDRSPTGARSTSPPSSTPALPALAPVSRPFPSPWSMAVLRLVGDPVVARLGPRKTWSVVVRS